MENELDIMDQRHEESLGFMRKRRIMRRHSV